MKNLLIIGARGFGREVYSHALECAGYNSEYIIKGFLDDKADALDGFNGYPPILCSVENYEIVQDDIFVCALGSVAYKRLYTEMILERGGEFATLIHPSVLRNANVKIGKGVMVGKDVTLSNDTVIGDYVTIHGYAAVGHDAEIGSWCNVGAYCFMGGFSKLEEEVTLNVRSTILPRITVRKGATVGAASLVLRNVKENTTVFGVPAQVLKF
ncbi:MAG TPA: acetyltransferase [Flavobacterium sp.]|jgi:sugar O-acyltransferase (sialic acid O-acetyltransferase NeuD family)